MVGGGSFGWEPGEWTDDTSMAIAIAEVAATGTDLREEEALDALTRRWHEWSKHAKDVGVQTRSVLSRAGRHGICAQTARTESAALHKLTGRTAGNGSLMRTAPLALACLDEEAAPVEAARAPHVGWPGPRRHDADNTSARATARAPCLPPGGRGRPLRGGL